MISFEKRKIVHYSLLCSIALLLVVFFALIYNEVFNESKLSRLKSELDEAKQIKELSDISRKNYFEAHDLLKKYVETNEKKYLDQFYTSISAIKSSFDTINYAKFDHIKIDSIQINQNSQDFDKMLSRLDSLILVQKDLNNSIDKDFLKIKKFDYDKILKDVDVETYMFTDSLERKNFFARIADAISGKVNIQKEKINVVIRLDYGDKEFSGSLDDFIKKSFDNVNSYYQNRLQNLRKNFNDNTTANNEFLVNSSEFLNYSSKLINEYDLLSELLIKTASENYENQLNSNKSIRLWVYYILFFLMLIIIGLLFVITRYNFIYEAKLENANQVISQNLNYKNRIIGMISHEIRGPLNMISFVLRNAIKVNTNSDLTESLKLSHFSVSSLSVLANQLLEYSKNENKPIELNKTQFLLNEELDNITQSMKVMVENSGNSFVLNSNLQDNLMVEADKVKLHQLFYNIVGNANKFTENGQIGIKMHVEKILHKEVSLKVIISDTGTGIPEDEIETIFDNDFQGKNAATVNQVGLGLGLNLCKEIINLHNGSIKVSNNVPKGTTVAFDINLETIQ